MESLSETEWDVVISGTGLQQSLLALALSRSRKKVLHVDDNDYYGGAEAAFSLQEADQWVANVNSGTLKGPFSTASVWKAPEDDATNLAGSEKLSFSRAYTLALGPQIIYSRSKLLSQLVSSKVYKQLEFQAVGNWWVYEPEGSAHNNGLDTSRRPGTIKRIPNGREDVFSDAGIDVRAKRSLMKFLRFVADYENQTELWQPHAESSLPEFLSASFNLPPSLQTAILALTLSLEIPSGIKVYNSLPRIARHLKSIGVFGPGFGAVIPKWGGASEIAQVACRAGAVGGGVYILGSSITETDVADSAQITLTLANNERIRTKVVVNSLDDCTGENAASTSQVSKMIAVVSSDMASLFTPTVEGAPTAAVTIVAFPSMSVDVDGEAQSQPVYIMVHSSDTGECPIGQCVLYASTLTTRSSKGRLEAAIATFLACFAFREPLTENEISDAKQWRPKILYSIYYEQKASRHDNSRSGRVFSFASSSMDLAFDDSTLDNVEEAWKLVMDSDAVSDSHVIGSYMVFEEREYIGGQDDDYDGI